MFIRSSRLFLRPVWAEDRPDLETALGIGARTQAVMPFAPRHPRLVITLPDQGAHVVGLIGVWASAGDCELRIWIADDYCGRGFATEATRAILPLVRALGHRRLFAIPPADCEASRRVLTRAGFACTGQLREHPAGASEAYAVQLCPPLYAPVDPATLMRAA